MKVHFRLVNDNSKNSPSKFSIQIKKWYGWIDLEDYNSVYKITDISDQDQAMDIIAKIYNKRSITFYIHNSVTIIKKFF